MQSRTNQLILWSLAVALLFPLFIQISGGIYNSPDAVTDSLGVLNKLPLPISIGACFLGILVFARNYRQALPTLFCVGTMTALMMVSMVFADVDHNIKQRKVLIAIQFLLPTVGLVLGQLIRDDENLIPEAFMWVLLLVVPIQLFSGWWQQTLTLTHYLYFFSIYQHFQFVPVIFVLAFCLVIVHLWESHKWILRFLTVVMGIYAIASASFLAIGLYGLFVLSFFGRRMWQLKTGRLTGLAVFGAGVVAAGLVIGLYYSLAQSNTSIIGDEGQYLGKFQTLANGKTPINVEQRLGDWRLYSDWIGESRRTLMLGHAEPPPREVKTSAHNWYLDFVYNFGLISLLPMLSLLAFTAFLLWRVRGKVPGQIWWLSGLVAFMVLVDSNFKVTLRQPYPGIFAYFLWGWLLARLHRHVRPLRDE